MLKMKALPLRLVHALDACAEAKVRNVAPEWRLRKAQREMNRCRRLIQASHKSAVKKIQIGQPQKSARSCLKQGDLIRAEAEIAIVDDRTIMLALSESRAYDSALEIRGAYKLTGNFHVNVEIVLEHLGAFDDVTFEIEPKSWLTRCPDRRHVGFRPNDTVQKDRFAEILRSINGQIGFVSKQPWWARPLHRSNSSRREGRPDRSSAALPQPGLLFHTFPAHALDVCRRARIRRAWSRLCSNLHLTAELDHSVRRNAEKFRRRQSVAMHGLE
jgi:hypothetical protein